MGQLDAKSEMSLDNLGVGGCCKVKRVANPVAFDSGLISLPDYSAKRLIQRKRRSHLNQSRNNIAAGPADDSLTNEEGEPKHLQFVDEFSSPFSWFPNNGFAYFNFTCSADKQAEGGDDKSKGENEEESSANVVSLSELRKRVLEEARQRKLDPILWEDVKKKQQGSQTPSTVRAQSKLNIQLVSPSNSSSPALAPKSEISLKDISPSQSHTSHSFQSVSVHASSSISTTSSSVHSQKPLFDLEKTKDVKERVEKTDLTPLNCSRSTLASDVENEREATPLKVKGQVEVTGVQVGTSNNNNNANAEESLTISEEYGESKMGGAQSFEFLLDW